MKSVKFSDEELFLLRCACRCLCDSLDISNGELKERNQDLFQQNLRDIELLKKIFKKLSIGGQ